jgi:hypothetical protein
MRYRRELALLLGVAAAMTGCDDSARHSTGQALPVADPVAPVAASGAGTATSGPVAGYVLGTKVSTDDAEELRYIILRALTDRYALDKGIVVMPDEREAYIAQLRQALEKDSAVAAMVGEETAEEHAARLQAADAFIRQWKINGALHKQYGGRIILQQGGPEPLDAYSVFLDERQAAGDFSIVDASMAEAFWRYYRDDAMHSFLPVGSPEEAHAFDVAPWLANP